MILFQSNSQRSTETHLVMTCQSQTACYVQTVQKYVENRRVICRYLNDAFNGRVRGMSVCMGGVAAGSIQKLLVVVIDWKIYRLYFWQIYRLKECMIKDLENIRAGCLSHNSFHFCSTVSSPVAWDDILIGVFKSASLHFPILVLSLTFWAIKGQNANQSDCVSYKIAAMTPLTRTMLDQLLQDNNGVLPHISFKLDEKHRKKLLHYAIGLLVVQLI